MKTIAFVLTLLVGFPWYLDARDTWRWLHTRRRECRMLDEEIDLLLP